MFPQTPTGDDGDRGGPAGRKRVSRACGSCRAYKSVGGIGLGLEARCTEGGVGDSKKKKDEGKGNLLSPICNI